MFVPKEYQNDSISDILRLIKDCPLATIICNEGSSMEISHLPVIPRMKGEKLVIESHLFWNNPQEKLIRSGVDMIMIVQSGGAYISSAWYEVLTAPTINYISVHLHGKPIVIDDSEEVHKRMRNFVRYFENRSGTGFDEKDLSDDYILKLLPLITYFEMEITDITSQFKLSQNRTEKERGNIAVALKGRSGVERYIGEWMSGTTFS